MGVAAGAVLPAQSASASAYTIGVYAPGKSGSTAQGWANLSRDCSGTTGCWNYIKIERQRWYGTQFVNGWWANANGWNSISANIGGTGCYNYRTTVDSYNDVVGGYGAGVNIGPVGTTANGTTVYRFRNTWSSGWNYLCA
jgi:hypothetical protein